MHPRKEENIWLIVFADITTNLMLFFLMLFALTRMTAGERNMAVSGITGAMSDTAAKVEAEKKQKMKAQEDKAVEGINGAISHGELSGKANVQVQDDKILVTLNPEYFFATGSAELTPATKKMLDAFVEPLKSFPPDSDILIEGHTDNVPVKGGRYRSNWELSIARAVSVIDFFVEKGISAGQLIAGGYGEHHPAMPNDTEDNRAKNRRIEIKIFRPQR